MATASSSKDRHINNCMLYQNVGELQKIVHQSQTEKLSLEQIFAKYHKAIDFHRSDNRREVAELELSEVRDELHERQELCGSLQQQLLHTLDSKHQLTAKASGLEEELQQLRELHEDLRTRHEALRSERELLEDTREELESQLGRLNLSEAELRQLVRGQQDNITDLQKQLSAKEMAYLDARRKGESLEEQLRLSEERKRSLDRLHREASAELKRTQMELSRSTRSGTENDLRHQQTIRGLEGKVRDIKRKLDEESIKNEELQIEMANLRKKQSWKKRSFSAEVHTTVEQERELTLTRDRDRDDFTHEGFRKDSAYGSSYRSSYGKSTLDDESQRTGGEFGRRTSPSLLFRGGDELPERPQSVVDFRERRDLEMELDTSRPYGRPAGRSIDDLHADTHRYPLRRSHDDVGRDRDGKGLASSAADYSRPLSSAASSDLRFREPDRLTQPGDGRKRSDIHGGDLPDDLRYTDKKPRELTSSIRSTSRIDRDRSPMKGEVKFLDEEPPRADRNGPGSRDSHGLASKAAPKSPRFDRRLDLDRTDTSFRDRDTTITTSHREKDLRERERAEREHRKIGSLLSSRGAMDSYGSSTVVSGREREARLAKMDVEGAASASILGSSGPSGHSSHTPGSLVAGGRYAQPSERRSAENLSSLYSRDEDRLTSRVLERRSHEDLRDRTLDVEPRSLDRSAHPEGHAAVGSVSSSATPAAALKRSDMLRREAIERATLKSPYGGRTGAPAGSIGLGASTGLSSLGVLDHQPGDSALTASDRLRSEIESLADQREKSRQLHDRQHFSKESVKQQYGSSEEGLLSEKRPKTSSLVASAKGCLDDLWLADAEKRLFGSAESDRLREFEKARFGGRERASSALAHDERDRRTASDLRGLPDTDELALTVSAKSTIMDDMDRSCEFREKICMADRSSAFERRAYQRDTIDDRALLDRGTDPETDALLDAALAPLQDFRATTSQGLLRPQTRDDLDVRLESRPKDVGRILRRGTSLEYKDCKDYSKTDEDRLLSKIEQDNRLLEELDRAKPRSSKAPQPQPTVGQAPAGNAPHTVSSQELEGLMKKLEQDNKVLAELDRKRLEKEALQTQQQQQQQQSCICGHIDTVQSGNSAPLCCQNAGQATTVTLVTPAPGTCPHVQLIQPGTSGTPGLTCCAAHGKPVALPLAPPALCTAMSNLPSVPGTGIGGTRCVSTGVNCATSAVTPAGTLRTQTPLGLQNKLVQHPSSYQHAIATPDTVITSYSAMSQKDFYDDLGVESVDYVEIPGRGRCRVYLARYSYDPLKQSPNENPEAELALSAGEYVLIFGEIDEDGFYNGELLDGQRGLVPSNFIEKLTGEDLFQFQTTVLYCYRDSDESSVAGTTYMTPDEGQYVVDPPVRIAPEDYHRMNGYIDMEEDDEPGGDEESFTEMDGALPHYPSGRLKPQFVVPAPQRLVLERQLNKSILIGWLPPDVVLGSLESYQVYVDGELRAVIRAGERTRALVESVDSSIPHRVSVRSVLVSGHHSRDAACTIVIGKNIPLAPSFVKAASITSTSALIRWIPSNSNFQHVVAVNNVDLKLVKPGVYRYSITGLSPNTVYRVSVRARPGKLLVQNTKKSSLVCSVEFRTLAKGIPDPPVDIRVEPGPQDGTILVTWLPVQQTNNPDQPGLPVSGYAVFASGRMVTQIDSPSGDHALLSLTHLLNSRTITVRTKADTLLSADSLPCHIPEHVLKGKRLPPREQQMLRMDESYSESDVVDEYGRRINGTGPVGVGVPGRRLVGPQGRLQQTTGYGASPPQVAVRLGPHGPKRNSAGQLVLEPEECLSDKEIYPQVLNPALSASASGAVPAIEVTKDRSVVDSYSEEEFDKHNELRRPISPGLRRGMGPRGRGAGIMMGHSGPTGGQRSRWFMALFDYNPLTMSPNPDAAHEELPFKEGQVIRVYGEKDNDGFYRGELNGRMGLVPCNMVSEVQGPYAGGQSGQSRPHFQQLSQAHNRPPGGQGPRRRMIALYDYDPSLSPNADAEMELSFKTGDILVVLGDMDEDGFYMAELRGVRGLVPSNFLADPPPNYPDQRGGMGPPMRGPPRSGHMSHGGPQYHSQHPPSGHPEHDTHGRQGDPMHEGDLYYDSRRGPPRGPSDYQGGGGPFPPRPNPGGSQQVQGSQGPPGQASQGGQGGYGYNANNTGGPVAHRDPQGYRDSRDSGGQNMQGQRPQHGRGSMDPEMAHRVESHPQPQPQW